MSGARYSLQVTPVVVANPAAGADFSYTIPNAPGGYSYLGQQRIVAIRAGLATSAAVANRQPGLYISDTFGHVMALVPYAAAQAASLTWYYTWAVGMPVIPAVNSQVANPLPDWFVLSQGQKIVALTAGLQAADQWSSIVVTIQAVP